jgi:hypothetical protein
MSTLNRRRIGPSFLGCVAIGAVALTGCGGGSSSSTTGASGAAGATPLSQDAFVSQANAVCKEENAKFSSLKALTPQSHLSDFATLMEQTNAIAQDRVTKLAALTPPTDLQAQYSQYLSERKAQIAQADQVIAAAKSGDESKVQAALQKAQATGANTVPEARALGITECVKNAQPQG